ncbi:DUF2712 domain-containing protein [Clostridium sp. AM49-4BH]|uniref:DUF2712 domain-containing protein n=1 Tax=Clostridium sp. AM49-4BH TaxID=2293035 RepID=UPI000E4BDC41|nr:DUF2712 domain-containing protein [Clostridium sp. AM49-4BH]RHQ10785.1 hypothetical protein DW981_11110 [Clostridium sp. AM49-4BH]
MRFNKTKLLSYGIVLSMTAVSMLSTSPLASAAGNVTDEEYSYVKGLDKDPFYTRWREKRNTSKVYCYPKKYAATYTIVKGCYYDSYEKKHINLRDCSSCVKIPVGVHGIITNSVREDGCNRASLYINSGKEQATQGVWSPDSTANSSYVVFK